AESLGFKADQSPVGELSLRIVPPAREGYYSGTSFAAPFVTAVLAILPPENLKPPQGHFAWPDENCRSWAAPYLWPWSFASARHVPGPGRRPCPDCRSAACAALRSPFRMVRLPYGGLAVQRSHIRLRIWLGEKGHLNKAWTATFPFTDTRHSERE